MFNFYLLFIHSENMGSVFNMCRSPLRTHTKIRFSVCPQGLKVQPEELSPHPRTSKSCDSALRRAPHPLVKKGCLFSLSKLLSRPQLWFWLLCGCGTDFRAGSACCSQKASLRKPQWVSPAF